MDKAGAGTATTRVANQKMTARIAGLWYVAFILLGAFAMAFVDEKLLIANNAAATLESFRANMTLYYLGFAAYCAGYMCFILSVNALCKIFRSTNRRLAQLMRALVVAGTVIALICKLAQYGAVIAPGLQHDTAASLISLHTNGVNAAGVFWGLWLIPLGLMILQSRLVPKAIGILLFVASVGHLLDCGLFFFASPNVSETILPALYVAEMAGEFALVLWLLIKGVRTQDQKSN